MSLRDVLDRLTAKAEAEVLALWERHQAGAITRSSFVTLAAAAIARSNARGTAVGDLAVAAAVMAQLGRPAAPVGLPVADDQPRLRKAVTSVLDDDPAYPDTADELAASQSLRLARLARAEPANATQDAVGEAMRRHPVKGWTRGLSAKACPLCRSLADGVMRSPDTRMARHAGCSCVQQPVAERR